MVTFKLTIQINHWIIQVKINITGKTPATGNIKNVEIAVALKYLSNFWRTPETPLINSENNLI